MYVIGLQEEQLSQKLCGTPYHLKIPINKLLTPGSPTIGNNSPEKLLSHMRQ